ncbi:uncharacterized protein LOC135492553 [Lineus longissimus]|uniref:uncharacterized protein LOC135492553 n=1 Tax=Lineus longissimus TaxID=88925 RepID=UPI002B4C6ACC
MPTGAIPFPFGRCRICADKATGIHYGVATCEGCKGFFKRSIAKAEKYRCFFGGSCTLTPKNRNRCKSCRFKRCMDTGMALDAVKMGRIPKIEKERALEEEKDKTFEGCKDSEPVYEPSSVSNTPCSSSGVSSRDRSPSDVVFSDPDSVTESKGLNTDERVSRPTLNFQQYPPNGRNYGPELPRLGNEYRDHQSLIHSQMKSGKPVAMEHSNSEVQVSLPNEIKTEGPMPRDFSVDPRVPGQNGVKVENSVPRGGLASYSDPGGLGANGQPIPRVNSAESHVSIHIGMKLGEHASRKVTESCFVPQASVSVGNHCNPITTVSTQPGEQFSSWPQPHIINGASGDTRLQNGSEKKTSMRSPGMTPSSVYNSEVVKQLFTHALENICQDGRKVQLIEKFLHNSDSATSSFGASCETSSAITVSSAPSGRDDHCLQDMMTQTVVSQQQVRTSFSVDEGQKHQTDLGPNRKLGRTNPTVNVTGTMFSGLKGGEIRQPISNQSHSHGMHKLPPTLPQLAAVMCPSHNTIPPTQYSSQGQPMEQHPSDWYSWSNDSFFKDRNNLVNTSDYQRHSTENTPAQQPNTCHHIKIKQEPQMVFQTSDCHFRSNGQMPNSNSSMPYRFPQNGQCLKSDTEFRADSCVDTTQCNDGGSKDVKREYDSNDIQIIESIFSDFATSSQTAKVEQNSNNPMLPPDTDDCFPLDDINVEVLDDENLCGEELVHHLQKWYEKIEVLSLSMTKALHDGLKAGTHLDMVIPLDSPKPKRADALHVWKLLFLNVEPCGVQVANFCRIIPGFSRIATEDKDLLVTSSFFDLWLICHSSLFFEGEVHILFPQDDKIKYCRYWMKQFLPEELIKKFFNFCDVFNSCNLTRGEIAVIMAVRATLPERPGLKDVEAVKKLNARYLNLMVQIIITNHTNEGGNILKKLFMVLPLLNDINEHQNKVIGSFRVDDIPCQDDEQPS